MAERIAGFRGPAIWEVGSPPIPTLFFQNFSPAKVADTCPLRSQALIHQDQA